MRRPDVLPRVVLIVLCRTSAVMFSPVPPKLPSSFQSTSIRPSANENPDEAVRAIVRVVLGAIVTTASRTTSTDRRVSLEAAASWVTTSADRRVSLEAAASWVVTSTD